MNLSHIWLFLCLCCSVSACSPGWFGINCHYMCHCDIANTCDAITGRCSTKCAKGWFGQGCQYQDVVTNSDVTIMTSPLQSSVTWLTDGDDSTCNADTSLNLLEISWGITAIPFTWLRIKVSKKPFDVNYTVSLTSSNNQLLNCIKHSWSFFNDTTIDYRCDINDSIGKISITGSDLKSLCSLFISGGRNVALKQSTSQSSTNYNGWSYLAVDGNRNSIWYSLDKNYSCTHTNEADETPSFTLTLDSYKVVNKYILYNREIYAGYDFTDRLKHFQLISLDENNKTLWTYQDPRNLSLPSYTVIRTQNEAVKMIRVLPTFISEQTVPAYAVQFKLVLTICEIELYGECVPGTWALECNETCPDQCKTSCHQDWGTCTSCVGYSDPPECKTECTVGKWGRNCMNDCNETCVSKKCNRITGLCDEICGNCSAQFGPSGNDYNEWVDKCTKNCSILFVNQPCVNTTEVCNQSCIGENNLQNYATGDVFSSLSHNAVIGIGIAIGSVSIIVVELCVFLIWYMCRRSSERTGKGVAKEMNKQHVYNATDSNSYTHCYNEVTKTGLDSNKETSHKNVQEKTLSASIYDAPDQL